MKQKNVVALSKRETFHISSFLAEATDAMRMFARTRGISLVVNEPDDMHIFADRTRLSKMLVNLVNNAIKFTGEGGTVRISTRIHRTHDDLCEAWQKEEDEWVCQTYLERGKTCNHIEDFRVPGALKYVDEGGSSAASTRGERIWVRLAVTDTGCGIASSDIAKVFQPYVQVGTTKGARKGTGLGLHICVSETRSMRGIFRCASTEGKGSLFEFAVPVTLSCTDEASGQSTGTLVPDEGVVVTGEGRDGSVLVVDDSAINVKILARQINAIRKDLTVRTASDGVEALEAFQEMRRTGNAPSIIFLDYHMPKMDGLEATRAIRKIEEFDGKECVYIVLFTADVSEGTIGRLTEAGCDRVLTKPTPAGAIREILYTRNEMMLSIK